MLVGGGSIGAPGDDRASGEDATRVTASDRTSFLRRVRELERALNGIRAKHFGGMRSSEIRKDGWRRFREALEEFAQPLPGEAISVALDVLEREATDVRLALLTFLSEQGTEQGDAALAWVSCFEGDEQVREAGLELLVARAETAGLPFGAKLVLDRALRSGRDAHAAASARAIEALGLLEAIPLLITAQVSGAGGSVSDANGAKAYILVGQQRTYVAGLTPVVGNSTVAFQPEMATLTTGSLLVVGDSMVTSYRTEVHESLVRMTTAAWGRSTAYLGWDVDGWRRWHREVFEPFLHEQASAGMLGPAANGG